MGRRYAHCGSWASVVLSNDRGQSCTTWQQTQQQTPARCEAAGALDASLAEYRAMAETHSRVEQAAESRKRMRKALWAKSRELVAGFNAPLQKTDAD